MEKENTQEFESIILREPKSKYEEPWIIEYVAEERNKQATWEQIADGLKERGETSITPQICSSLFKKAIAKSITTTTEAKDDFIGFNRQLRDIYGDAIQLMGNYVKTLRTINEELGNIVVVDEKGKIDVLTTQFQIAKQIPIATGLMKVVRDYVETQKNFNDTIQETKEKDIVWNEQRMLEYTAKFLPIYLKQLASDGKIEIKDKSVLKDNS